MSLKLPYWRLSGFYFFYFAILGTFVPFWSLYLRNIGIANLQIGLLMSIFVSARIFSPLVFGHIADTKNQASLLIKFTTVLMLICFVALSFSSGFGWLAIMMFGFGFAFSGLIPQLESLTMDFLATSHNSQPKKYSIIRLWGSTGYLIVVVVAGILLEEFAISLLPIIIGILILSEILVAFSIPQLTINNQPSQVQLRQVLQTPKTFIFLLISFLQQASHAAYYTYFSIFLVDIGYATITVGLLWAVAVIAEIIIFTSIPKFFHKFDQHKLICFGLIASTIRWTLTGFFTNNLLILLLAQLMHALSFGLLHAIGINYISEIFPKNLRGRGQALYSIASFGFGGFVGGVFASLAWETLGGKNIFLISAGISLVASIIWYSHIKTTTK